MPLNAGGPQPVTPSARAAAGQATTPKPAPRSTQETIAKMGLEIAFEQITNDVLEGEEEDILVHARELLEDNF